MYDVSAEGVDERMINVHYYYYYICLRCLRRRNRIDPEKCTDQCDETQGNNSTEALSTICFSLQVQVDRPQKKKEAKKSTDKNRQVLALEEDIFC